MGIFLNHFSRQLAPKVHAVLILDQAGWHDERALRVPGNATLLPLLSASPELNLVERIWLSCASDNFPIASWPTTTRSSPPPAGPGTGSWPRRGASPPSPPPLPHSIRNAVSGYYET